MTKAIGVSLALSKKNVREVHLIVINLLLLTILILLASPNKRCKQEPDTPSPESPKKPAKRRKLSASKKKADKIDNQMPAYNSQLTPQASMMMPGAVSRNDISNMSAMLMKDYTIKVDILVDT